MNPSPNDDPHRIVADAICDEAEGYLRGKTDGILTVATLAQWTSSTYEEVRSAMVTDPDKRFIVEPDASSGIEVARLA